MTTRRWIGAAAGVGLVVAAGVAIRWASRPTPGHERPERDPFEATLADAAGWFDAARDAARGPGGDGEGAREAWLCRILPGKEPTCASGRGKDWAEASRAAAAGHEWLAEGVLRLDLVVERRPARFPSDFDPHQAGTRGIAAGSRFVPPSDVLARGLFRATKEDGAPTWDLPSVAAALGQPETPFAAESIETVTLVQAAPGAPPLRTYRLHAWDAPSTEAPSLARAASLGGEHLLRLVAADGRIRYRYDPRRGKELSGQNLLRHAGTTWSLVRAHERFGDPRYLEAADRALGFLLRHTGTDEREGHWGGGRVRYVIEGSHLKLGGAGLGLLAIADWQRRTGDAKYAEAARQLATFLLSQQQESGQFWSYAPKVPGGEPRTDVSAYYPGEAILGLTAWYALDPDPRWRDAAVRGASWLIEVRDAGEGPDELDADHWLMMALERLHAVTGEPRFLAHAVLLAETVAWQQGKLAGHEVYHRDWAGGFYEPPRATPAAIRAEGVGAVLDLCRRTQTDCDRFVPVLHGAVRHLLAAQYRPEDAWWTPDPLAVVGGFAGGIVDPELRNDYTQHAFCAILAAERHPMRADGR
jgi:hypothetical protein